MLLSEMNPTDWKAQHSFEYSQGLVDVIGHYQVSCGLNPCFTLRYDYSFRSFDDSSAHYYSHSAVSHDITISCYVTA